MKPSKQVMKILNKSKSSDLLKLAELAGNKQIYLDFITNKKNLKAISEELNLEEELENYFRELKKSGEKFDDARIKKINQYRHFIMEKICFPNGIDDDVIKVKEILNRKTWQYGFYILPEKNIQHSNKDKKLTENEFGFFDDRVFWKEEATQIGFFDEIIHVLPIGTSWNPQIILYGHEKGNHFILSHENEIVQSVFFRINLTSKYDTILVQIIEFCLSKNLVFVDKNLNILPLDFFIIKNNIENSEEFTEYQQSLE